MLDKICGFYLDEEQTNIVLDDAKYLLVAAGAGSGKTMTILGKINYLIKVKKIDKEKILCISFTKAAAESLKTKIKKEFKLDMNVYTFHKLGLEILKKENISYEIASDDLLEHVTHKFLYEDILNNQYMMQRVLDCINDKFKNKDKYLKSLEKKKKEVLELEKLIMTFIRLFKCNGYTYSDFPKFLEIIKKNWFTAKKEKELLIIILNIYLSYEKYLEDNLEIDFDDMIIKATEIIENKKVNLDYQYIIIDEYQDTSYIRFLLVKKIIERCGAALMVVGDDFQSIYRFTGCDVDLFLNFSKYFEGAKIKKIRNTYRNSQELIKIAGDFIMQNKKQIRKNLHSNKHLDYPIEIIYYRDIKIAFKRLIERIYQENKEILVLGRNNKDVNKIIDNTYEYKDGYIIDKENGKRIKYLTVHKSKGLEADNVIMLNLEDDILGFPNKIKNEHILRLVSKSNEVIPYAEERRLFYVGLTRTKNKVYLLVPENKPSIFVEELKRRYRKSILISNYKNYY